MSKIIVHTETIRTNDVRPMDRNYDVGIVFNSSESRSLAYAGLFKAKSIAVMILVNFDGGDNENKRRNWEKNVKELEHLSVKTILVRLNSVFDYQKNLDEIATLIIRHRSKTNKTNVFMDVTGAPLIYSVALTKFLFRLFPVPGVSLLNVSGRYAERGEQQFSEGEQFDIYIPGYFGNPDHSKQLHYVFLLGYDGDRSLNIYRSNLPDKVSVIVPSPGYETGNDRNTISNNRDFLLETGYYLMDDKLPRKYSRNKNLYLIDISDITAVMRRIEEIYEEDKDNYEIRLVPLGPKPHAIGAALAAVFNNEISIVYQVPRKYFMSEIPCGDNMWLYDLEESEAN